MLQCYSSSKPAKEPQMVLTAVHNSIGNNGIDVRNRGRQVGVHDRTRDTSPASHPLSLDCTTPREGKGLISSREKRAGPPDQRDTRRQPFYHCVICNNGCRGIQDRLCTKAEELIQHIVTKSYSYRLIAHNQVSHFLIPSILLDYLKFETVCRLTSLNFLENMF